MSGSGRASVTRPFYTTHGEAYDLPIIDPVEPWVEAVDAHTNLDATREAFDKIDWDTE